MAFKRGWAMAALGGWHPVRPGILSGLILAALMGLQLQAEAQEQRTRPDAPSTRVPATPKPIGRPGKKIEKPHSPRPLAGDKVVVERLDGIVIVKSDADIKPEGVAGVKGVSVHGIPLLETEEFKQLMQPYLGRPLTDNGLLDIHDDIILYCRERNRPLVDAIYLDQTVVDNTIQIWFLEGTVGNVQVVNEGQKWFRNEFISKQVRLKPGEVVDTQTLSSDIDWLNRNPFRSVDVRFQQSTNLGQSDVVLDVQDRIPIRPYVGFEDTGTRTTGEKRFVGGLNWGNAFGLDHQLNYQYTADIDFDLVSAHSGSYTAPLPWRHTLTVFGSYVEADLDLGTVDEDISGQARGYQASMRYSAPLPTYRTYRQEVSGGLDFKRSNNNLEFGGDLVAPTDTDIFQFILGYSGLMADQWGQTSMSLEGFYSPGGVTTFNEDESFNELRRDTSADYAYGRMTAERITGLPMDFSWILRGLAQLSSDRLLPSEQLGVGGFRTVRGYDERLLNGDHGWIINNEIRTPRMRLGNLLGAAGSVAGDYIQFLAFFDYGEVRFVDKGADDEQATLAGTGLGLRYTLSNHLSVRFDYGVALMNKSVNENRRDARAHFGIMGSF